MNRDEVLEGLLGYARDDWLALWVIVRDVEELLGVDDPEEIVETTVALAMDLLASGLVVGAPPVHSAVRFIAWQDQDPGLVADHIRRVMRHRGGAPAWEDGPWFASPRLN